MGNEARETLCIHCKAPVHKTTAAERYGLIEGLGTWKHDDGFWFCGNGNDKAEGLETGKPLAGKTLADFANSEPGKLFKRPMHFNPYTMRDHLVEVEWSDRGRTFLPRLTAEDLTATDWQEVTE